MRYPVVLKETTTLHKVKITALGCYTPPRVLTNQDLEKMVETNDQWILERVGIRERHIAGPDMATSDMAVEAARCALAQRGVDAAEVNAIIVCTVTPDMFFPSTACLVQNGLGARGRLGVRPDRGLLELRLRADHRRAPGDGGHAPEGAGDRRRHHEPHHRLHRPRHLRAVRRRRRGHADGAGRGWRGSSASSIFWAKWTARAATL